MLHAAKKIGLQDDIMLHAAKNRFYKMTSLLDFELLTTLKGIFIWRDIILDRDLFTKLFNWRRNRGSK